MTNSLVKARFNQSQAKSQQVPRKHTFTHKQAIRNLTLLFRSSLDFCCKNHSLVKFISMSILAPNFWLPSSLMYSIKWYFRTEFRFKTFAFAVHERGIVFSGNQNKQEKLCSLVLRIHEKDKNNPPKCGTSGIWLTFLSLPKISLTSTEL